MAPSKLKLAAISLCWFRKWCCCLHTVCRCCWVSAPCCRNAGCLAAPCWRTLHAAGLPWLTWDVASWMRSNQSNSWQLSQPATVCVSGLLFFEVVPNSRHFHTWSMRRYVSVMVVCSWMLTTCLLCKQCLLLILVGSLSACSGGMKNLLSRLEPASSLRVDWDWRCHQ